MHKAVSGPVARRSTVLAGAFAGTVMALSAAPALAGGCYGVECYRRVETPPVFDTISEQRLVRAPRTVYRTTPPVYGTVSERVMVSPGGRFWQTSRDAYGQLVGCWVTSPPRYAVTSRRVLVQPSQVIPETLPPVYANYSRRVLVAPASSQWVPAGYGPGPVGRFGLGIGSIPDAVGITGASSADIGVGLGLSSGSVYDGY